jgi:DNA-binding transcriptional regulator YiaG
VGTEELTQTQFAARFAFSINTLRHWEQGKRRAEEADESMPSGHC